MLKAQEKELNEQAIMLKEMGLLLEERNRKISRLKPDLDMAIQKKKTRNSKKEQPR